MEKKTDNINVKSILTKWANSNWQVTKVHDKERGDIKYKSK